VVWLGYRGGGEKTMQTQEEIQLEQAQAESLRKKQCEQWRAENSEAVNSYDEEVEANGVFSDDVRSF
jgi:antitoxin CcdA